VRIEQVELLSVRKKRAPIAPTLELIHADKINDGYADRQGLPAAALAKTRLPE
jgi:hypothetical protein